jgi:transposase
MSDRTTSMFALPDFRVLDVTLEPNGGRRVLVESVAEHSCCPACGLLSGLIKDRPTSRVKDLPHGPVPLVVFVPKRRFACAEDHGIAWWTVHRILVKAAADVLGTGRTHHDARNR